MTDTTPSASTPKVAADLLREIVALVRNEISLARAELAQKAEGVLTGLSSLLAGAVLFVAALNVLLGAIVIGLTNLGMAAGWAALAVGGVTAAVAVALVFVGATKLDPDALKPKRTIRQAKADAKLVKETLS